jgi:hypothetical protein
MRRLDAGKHYHAGLRQHSTPMALCAVDLLALNACVFVRAISHRANVNSSLLL